ncbi:MAG: 2-dehydro-3-deoxyphosphogluconate aldolase [Acidobacteriia bacterium]|nr:2-dehydro-3-deoxyphosphogluconate aldolase [Terriglobia bacterium]
MNREDVRRRIEEIGIIPSIRVSSAEDAMFAAEAVSSGGIPIVEVHLTVPDAEQVISSLLKSAPRLVVGAGGVTDVGTAERCLQAGAQFITSDGLDPEIVSFTLSKDSVVIPGTLTPTDVMTAWKTRPDFVKVVPCGHVGGDSYLRDLKAMFPNVPMIAAGGVNQLTASNFILAGAVALGIGAELIPGEAVRYRQPERIAELARRFIGFVKRARHH